MSFYTLVGIKLNKIRYYVACRINYQFVEVFLNLFCIVVPFRVRNIDRFERVPLFN